LQVRADVCRAGKEKKMVDCKLLRAGIAAWALGMGAGWAFPGPDDTRSRWLVPATTQNDTALLRETRPEESSLQALRRSAREEKTARIVLGTSLVILGPVLAAGGFINLVAEDIFGDQGPLPEITFALGLGGLGMGIYQLASPWSAERRWNQASEKILLGIRPDGRGVRLVVRF
jgi:hypothetical protein